MGARQLVRQDGGSGDPFYGAQPLQPTQTRAPTGERLRKIAVKVINYYGDEVLKVYKV